MVREAGPPLYFHGYRRGRELGRGASGQVRDEENGMLDPLGDVNMAMATCGGV